MKMGIRYIFENNVKTY